MKRSAVVAVVVGAAFVFAGAAFAHMSGWGGGPGYGGYGMMGGYYGGGTPDGNVNVQNLKKFQKETLGLRDELVTKQAELANEYNKPAPDTARIEKLEKQIIGIQAKIQKSAEENGLTTGTADNWGPGRGYGYGMGPGMMYGYGNGNGYNGYGMGPGMMYGYGNGYNGYGMGPGMMYGY